MHNKLTKQSGLLLLTVISISSVIIDQITKWLVLRGLFDVPHNGVLDITLVWNRGIAFGIPIPIILWIGIVCILGYVLIKHFLIHKLYLELLPVISGGLILGGAVSNIIDRIFRGAVVDYIDLHWWPVFNLADSFVVIGAIIMILYPYQKK